MSKERCQDRRRRAGFAHVGGSCRGRRRKHSEWRLRQHRPHVHERTGADPESALGLSRLDDAIQRDREVAHADSCGMPNGIRDRTRRAGDPELAHALDAERH